MPILIKFLEGFECEKCNEVYDTYVEAEKCEKQHKED